MIIEKPVKYIFIGENTRWKNLFGSLDLIESPITDMQKSIEILNWLNHSEIVDRLMLFEQTEDEDQDPVMSIGKYNVLKEEKIPYIIVVIDGLTKLINSELAEVREAIYRIRQLGGPAGIFIVDTNNLEIEGGTICSFTE